jgi:hypothetical protein
MLIPFGIGAIAELAHVSAEPPPTSLTGIALVLLIIFGVFAWLTKRGFQTSAEVYAQAMNEWKRRHEIWDRSVYCARCDSVSDPLRKIAIRSHDIERLYF